MPVKFGITSIRFWFFLVYLITSVPFACTLYYLNFYATSEEKSKQFSKSLRLNAVMSVKSKANFFLKQRFQDFLWHDRFLFTIYKHIPIVWLAQFLKKGPSFQEFNLCSILLFAKKKYVYTLMLLGILKSKILLN